MFCILEIQPCPRLSRFRRWFWKTPQPTVEKVAVRGGAFFYKLNVTAEKTGAVDLSFLPQTLGAAAKRILPCGDGLPNPLPPPLELFTPRVFETTLFLNTVYDFLKTNRAQLQNCTIGFNDPAGTLQRAVCDFVPLAKSMRIFSADSAKYEAVQAEILEDYGLSLILCESPLTEKDVDILLSPFTATANGKIGTLSLRCGVKAVLAGEGISLPAEYSSRCPVGTNPLLFAAALYECCNVLDLGNLQYTKLVPANPTKSVGMY